MTKSTKAAVTILALAGTLLATAAVAETGPGAMQGAGGPDGAGGRGAMLLEMFDTVDADKDGKITAAEMEAFRQARFAEADTNGDALLSADELTAFHVKQMTERMAERTGRMMTWMDANGDGSLSADEMPDGPSADRLARLDADGDGAISKEEAQAMQGRFGEHMKKRGHHQKGWMGFGGMMDGDDE